MQGTPRDVVTDTSRMERVQQSGAIARLGWPQDTSTDWEGDIPKDQDKVRDCRERCSSWTGLDDLRGRQPPSPFLYVFFVSEMVQSPRTLLASVCPSISAPIFSQPRYQHLSTRLRERGFELVVQPASNHPQSSPPFAQTLLNGTSIKEGSQRKSCLQLAHGAHSNIPAHQKHRVECSGQLNPDTQLSRFSASAGGIPSLC